MTERFTERAKWVLERALREALSLGHNYIGTEHLLLALAKEEQGLAFRVLEAAGLDYEATSERICALLRGPGKTVRETIVVNGVTYVRADD